ncbi:MAG: hypothetical protein PQJ60_09850 [Spirochaetales bacterium]|nr:hypothetical protein [Spirochaetales bacterium]
MLKLKNIDNIELQKSDVPLYYIKKYYGDACFEEEGKNPSVVPISFIIEMEPTGQKKINIKIKGEIHYPLLPVIKMLKDEIKILDEKGKLL